MFICIVSSANGFLLTNSTEKEIKMFKDRGQTVYILGNSHTDLGSGVLAFLTKDDFTDVFTESKDLVRDK